MLNEHIYPDRDALFVALYDECMNLLQKDLRDNDRLSLLLSGGNTPVPLYERLAAADLPWQRLYPALVDERWVDTGDAASNEGMLRRIFAGKPGFLQNLTGMKTLADNSAAAQDECIARYLALPSPACFCLLGLGADGHTASLFPHAQGLQQALQTTLPCQAIVARESEVTGKLTQRMSLSVSGIMRSRRILLLFTGESKWNVYQEALENSDAEAMPISAVLRQQAVPVTIFYCP